MAHAIQWRMSRQSRVAPDQPLETAEKPAHSSFVDIGGEKFSRLTVVGYAGKRGSNQVWSCRCDCGFGVYVLASNLRSGQTTSCGCAHSEMVSEAKTKHALHGSPEYVSHQSMIARCKRPVVRSSHHKRGITVCDRWLHGDGTRSGFECFVADMGRRPAAGYSVDRLDNSRGYEPDNCRWATRKEQARNTGRNKFIRYGGELITLVEAAERSGVKRTTISARLRRGWSDEAALLK